MVNRSVARDRTTGPATSPDTSPPRGPTHGRTPESGRDVLRCRREQLTLPILTLQLMQRPPDLTRALEVRDHQVLAVDEARSVIRDTLKSEHLFFDQMDFLGQLGLLPG